MYTGGPKTGSKDADPLDDKTCTKFLFYRVQPDHTIRFFIIHKERVKFYCR